MSIDKLQRRVGRRLEPHHPRLGPDRGLSACGVAEVDIASTLAGADASALGRGAARAAVDVVHDHDVRTVSSSSSAVAVAARPEANAKPRSAAFEIGDAALEGQARLVLAARVLEALVNAGLESA